MNAEMGELKQTTWQELFKSVAYDVDDMLSLIAYDDKSHDPDFIEENQRKIQEKHKDKVEAFKDSGHFVSVVELDGMRMGVYSPTALVIDAYYGLIDINPKESPEKIKEEAVNVIQENLVVYFDLQSQEALSSIA